MSTLSGSLTAMEPEPCRGRIVTKMVMLPPFTAVTVQLIFVSPWGRDGREIAGAVRGPVLGIDVDAWVRAEHIKGSDQAAQSLLAFVSNRRRECELLADAGGHMRPVELHGRRSGRGRQAEGRQERDEEDGAPH